MKIDGNAIVFCDGAFNTTNGKTAHGLVRFTQRYRILSVIDSRYDGKDAGEILDGKANGIPVVADLKSALLQASSEATHFVVGLAPDGGRADASLRRSVGDAIAAGLNIDSGLHYYFSEDPEFTALAETHGVKIRDIRKPPELKDLHFFSGEIAEVESLKIAILGTDSAVGKRTTAWLMVHAMEQAGLSVELIGTGQTAWLQGARYSLVLDSLVNDFVAGEIENAVVRAWREKRPDIIIIEGQGSIMNPAYPGGFEILAAGRPDIIVLQHAPARREYDGFPGYLLHPLSRQIEVLELLSDKPVVAVTINHEDLDPDEIPATCTAIHNILGIPAFDVLQNSAGELVNYLSKYRTIAAGRHESAN